MAEIAERGRGQPSSRMSRPAKDGSSDRKSTWDLQAAQACHAIGTFLQAMSERAAAAEEKQKAGLDSRIRPGPTLMSFVGIDSMDLVPVQLEFEQQAMTLSCRWGPQWGDAVALSHT
ncbi:MAG: hypothetical protein U0744_11875 [Gemmataceae bacterium]